jgi:hypothetical protein
MNTQIKIQPVTKELNSLYILDVNVRLDNTATVIALVTNEENLGVQYQLLMDSEAYSQWGNDDNYVINWVLNELNLTRA